MRKVTLSRRLDALERNMSAYRGAEPCQSPAAWLTADPRYRAITNALERAGYCDAQAYDPKSGKQVFVGLLPECYDVQTIESMKAIGSLLVDALNVVDYPPSDSKD